MKRLLVLFLGMLCYTANSFSQTEAMHCCNMNSSNVLNGHQTQAGMWMFSYSYMNSFMQNNYTGTTKVSDQTIFEKYLMSPVNMHMDMHMLTGMYGLSDKLSVMVMVDYNSMSMEMKMLPGGMNMGMGSSPMTMKSTSHGFGDTKISGIYQFYSFNGHSISADLGLSLPTGSINKTEKVDISHYGDKVPYMMQTGSGTFDWFPAISYNYLRTKYSIGAEATALIRPYFNRLGYKLGNEFSVNTWTTYEWLKNTTVTLRLNYTVAGRIQGSDPDISAVTEPAADPQNYGGSFLKGYLGLAYYFTDGSLKNTKISAEFGLPVYQYFNGVQTANKFNSMISWALMF